MRDMAEVVSGPRKMSMASDNKTETEKELGEIRREIIEARNLVIKTDNQLKNLHAELKSVRTWQLDVQKRQWIASAAAYVAFAVLCLGGGIAISSARTSTASAERERLEKQVNDLSGQLDKQKAELAAITSAQRSAADVYRMMTTLPGDERLKGVDALMKLDTSRLTALERQALNDRAAILRNEIGQAAFERGKSAFRRNDMATAVSELTRFVAMNPSENDLLDASFFLGSALNTLKKHELAVPHLARFVNQDKHSKSREYAMLLLAQSYEATGQLDKAADTVRDALGTYPNSQFAPQFRARLSSVKRLSSAGADSPAVQAATAGMGQPAAGTPAVSVTKPASVTVSAPPATQVKVPTAAPAPAH